MASGTEFEVVLSKFLSGLTEEERKKFKISEYRDVEKEIARIEKQLREDRMQRGLQRMKAFLAGLQLFSGTIDTFVQIKSDILAAIWGPIKLILQITYTTTAAFDCILDTFKDIGDCMPRTLLVESTFTESSQIRMILAGLYEDILEFFSMVLKVLRKRAWKQLFEILWQNMGGRLNNLRQRILSRRDSLDKEANSINIFEAQRFYAESRARFEEENNRRALMQLEACIDLLRVSTFNDSLDRLEDILAGSPADGSWLLQNESFQSWASFDPKSQPILWVTGIPGSGKTLLAYQVMTRLLPNLSANAVLIGLFLDGKDNLNQAKLDVTASATKSIIAQLLEEDASTLVPVLHGLIGKVSRVSGPTRNQLQNWLKQILEVTELTEIYIIIDGIDEVDNFKVEPLLRWLISLIQSHDCLKLWVSSRVISPIKSMIGTAPTIYAHDHNSKEIEAYVETRKTDLEASFDLQTGEVDSLMRRVLAKCSGMFLYCFLMLETLRRQLDLRSLREAADNLPDGLDKVYLRLVQDIYHLNEAQKKAAVKILEFLVCVRGKARVSEVQKTFNIKDNDRAFDPDMELRKSLEELCGPMIEVRNGIVRFVHFTAKEFIQSAKIDFDAGTEKMLMNHPISYSSGNPDIKSKSLGLFPIQMNQANSDMAVRALRYLCFDCFNPDLSESELAVHIHNGNFLWIAYACRNWLSHVKLALRRDHPQHAVETHLNSFLSKWLSGRPIDDPTIKIGLKMIEDLTIISKHLRKQLAYVVYQSSQGQPLGTRFTPGLKSLDSFYRRVLLTLDRVATTTPIDSTCMDRLNRFYGSKVFYCPKPSCPHSLSGFPSFQVRVDHILEHERRDKGKEEDYHYSKFRINSIMHPLKRSKPHDKITLVTDALKNLQPFKQSGIQIIDGLQLNTPQWKEQLEIAIHKEDMATLRTLMACYDSQWNTWEYEREKNQAQVHLISIVVGSDLLGLIKEILTDESVKPVLLRSELEEKQKIGPYNSLERLNPLIYARSITMVEHLLNLGMDPLESIPTTEAELKSASYDFGRSSMTIFTSYFCRKHFCLDLIDTILDFLPSKTLELLGFDKDYPKINESMKRERISAIQGSLPIMAARGGRLRQMIQVAEERGLPITTSMAQTLLDTSEAIITPDVLQIVIDAGAKTILGGSDQVASATRAKDLPRMTYLLDNGASVNKTSKAKKHAPIQYAASSGYIEGLQMLIDRGANVSGLPIKTSWKNHQIFPGLPVVRAAKSPAKTAYKALKLLLEAGASPLHGITYDKKYYWERFYKYRNIKELEKVLNMSIKEFMKACGTDVDNALKGVDLSSTFPENLKIEADFKVDDGVSGFDFDKFIRNEGQDFDLSAFGYEAENPEI